MKEKIKLSGVPETMLQTIYARAKESGGRGAIHDAKAEEIIERLDYDFSVLEQKSRSLMQRFGFLEVAMRQNDFAYEVQEYLKTHPTAAVVNLGCLQVSSRGYMLGYNSLKDPSVSNFFVFLPGSAMGC